MAGAYQYANRTQKTSANKASFTEQLQKTGEAAETSKVDAYQKYLEQKYGPIMVRSVGSDQKSMDALGTGTYGMNNIAIAPNILEEMANNPEKAAHYEKIIDDFFASQPMVKAQMAAGGFEIQSYGVVIHPDGTANYYVCGDVSPEKKAKIEAQMKAEDEEKAKRKQQYREQSEKAAEKRKMEMEIAYKRQTMEEMLASRVIETGRVTYAGTPESLRSAVAAYEMSAFITPGILN
ncbi:hypothetical protein C823_000842 [Eubacterium plexicaudatum ASF492]|uniref:Uncharacterized protein n=1 Tax=Eubacterium plexicaudatum ASF492 TaxID=1235802 RepID=N2A2P9_9FIRM|nr:hypothetical protein C823_000842 [Eubacterium plexicaudatum ASF492]